MRISTQFICLAPSTLVILGSQHFALSLLDGEGDCCRGSPVGTYMNSDKPKVVLTRPPPDNPLVAGPLAEFCKKFDVFFAFPSDSHSVICMLNS